MSLRIDLEGGCRSFRPGEEIAGRASWSVEDPPEEVQVQLGWHTQGKGTQDCAVVDTVRFGTAAREGAESFRFRAPEAPYSFSGRLISLVWSVRIEVLPSGQAERVEFTLSPTGREIVLAGAG